MDLLVVPQDPSWPTAPAPYVCGEGDPWDGGPFLSFPKRSGRIGWVEHVKREMFPELQSDELWTELLNKSPRTDKDRWLQRWLFFGLIAEFLGLNRREDGSDPAVGRDQARRELATLRDTFTRREGEGEGEGEGNKQSGNLVLTGLPILELVPVAFQRATEANANLEAYFLPHMSKCLRLTYFLVAHWNEERVEPHVKHAILALGDFLSGAILDMVYKIDPMISQRYSFGTPWQDDYLLNFPGVKEQMLLEGWCISDIMRAQQIYGRLSPLHFFSRLKKSGPKRDHSRCTDNLCLSAQIMTEDYHPMHSTTDCSCSDANFDASKVHEILEQDNYPVLRFSTNDSGDIEVIAEMFSPNVPYVALSHVWADGLGNPAANMLPQCQIIRLSKLVDDLGKRTGLASDKSYRLWLDTLCCPAEILGKKLALKKMPEVYWNASQILILDESVSLHETESLNPAELNMIFWSSSRWMRRLWTLQEGALAKDIWIAFADKMVNFQWELRRLRLLKDQDLRYWHLWSTIFQEGRKHVELYSFFPVRWYGVENVKQLPETSLYTVQRALFYRGVSVASDEAICLATLLDLDLAFIIETSEAEERMIRLWQLLCQKYNGIPATLIFSLDDTCTRPGWRWAPRSLVNPRMNGYDSLIGKCLRFGSPGEPAIIPRGFPGPLGLRVEMPGQLVRARAISISPVVEKLLEDLMIPGEPYMIYPETETRNIWRFSDTYRTYVMSPKPDEEVDAYDEKVGRPMHAEITGRRCAILFNPTNIGRPVLRGMLVEIICEIEDNGAPSRGGSRKLRAHPIRDIVVTKMDSKTARLMNKADSMAKEAAVGFANKWLSDRNTIEDEKELDAAREDLKGRLKDAIDQALISDHEFNETFTSIWHRGMENAWKFLPRLFLARAEVTELPDDQTWYFD